MACSECKKSVLRKKTMLNDLKDINLTKSQTAQLQEKNVFTRFFFWLGIVVLFPIIWVWFTVFLFKNVVINGKQKKLSNQNASVGSGQLPDSQS